MITMTHEEHNEIDDQKLFTPGEAVEYLREKRGIILSVVSLRQRRLRGTAKASRVLTRSSLWTKEELDALKVSPRTKLVPSED